MSPWVMTLNEISPELQKQLPATDTRLRPDIRCLEEGVYDQVCLQLSLAESPQSVFCVSLGIPTSHSCAQLSGCPNLHE